jgi:hypothetical protein
MTTLCYRQLHETPKSICLLLSTACIATAALAADIPTHRAGQLWQDPADLESRDLLYGSGGKNDAPPPGPFQFVKEDLNGTNPKFTVTDANGAKWKVKLGAEARPETVATRFVWAAGYFVDEDYFVPKAQITEVPKHGLKRLKGLISSDSTVTAVRFERQDKTEKKDGRWSWKMNPFAGSREWNGLRVMMAVLNNWDLKDENNTVYKAKGAKDSAEIYEVSDLGASFGTTNLVPGHEKSRGNLQAFEHSHFIKRKTRTTVDFATPGRPAFPAMLNPWEFSRIKLEWIGRDIPRADAKWIGLILSRLSPSQIRDAFRSADYSPAEVERFSQVVERRIAELNAL